MFIKNLEKIKKKKKNKAKKDKFFFWVPQWRLKDIGDYVHIGHTVTPFKSIGKSGAVDKTASHFDNANLKVKMIKGLIQRRNYDADIAHYLPGTLDLVCQGMIQKIKIIEQPIDTAYKEKETLNFELILEKKTTVQT